MGVGTRQKERTTPLPSKDVQDRNNGSGPVISEAEATLLEGLGLTGKIDLSAPITTRPISTRGRRNKMLEDERFLRIRRGLESELPAARKAFEENTSPKYAGFAFIGTNSDFNGVKSALATWAKAQAFQVDGVAIKVTVTWDKHESSPSAASTKAEDAKKPVIYLASVAMAVDEDAAPDEDEDETDEDE